MTTSGGRDPNPSPSDPSADVPAKGPEAGPGGRGPLRIVALVAAGLVVIGGGGYAAVQFSERSASTSASQGAEGTRTFEGVPTEMPASFIPEGAARIEGTVARLDESWSASVRFDTEGDHEELARSADPGMLEEGFTMRQRAFDDDTMQVIYDGEDGSVLTVTYLRAAGDGEPVRVAAVLTSP